MTNPKQIPKNKSQITNHFVWDLVLGAWNLFVIWCLGFGIFLGQLEQLGQLEI